MSALDIIPDIHGQAGKLTALLTRLGWRETRGAWRAPGGAQGREALFLGDLIDRGPENAAVLAIVRGMVEAGSARCLMGNHELNALRYHAVDLGAPAPLRAQSEKNRAQHASFLAEFAHRPAERRAALDFFAGLPFWLETHGIRAVHAAWDDALCALVPGPLGIDGHLAAADPAHPLHMATEVLAKGPEIALPGGARFADKGGHAREAVRIAWWRRGAATFRAAAASVPDPGAVPDIPLPEGHGVAFYPPEAPPVFFGHYWLTGTPRIETPNALCLDYSAGMGGPLLAYTVEDAALPLDTARITIAQA